MDLRSGWVCYVGYGPKDHLLGTFDEYMTAQLSELVANEKYIRFTESTRQNEGYVADWTHAIARRNANVEPAASRMPEPGLAALTPSRRNEDFSAAIDWPVYSIGTMEKHIVVYDLADGSQLA
jgi:hypothetical protein